MKAMLAHLSCAVICLVSLAVAAAAEPDSSAPERYEPTIESLKQAEAPEWFRDAKLGIFMHWGPESIPGVKTTWYARWMYQQGTEAYKYHCKTYGHPSKFGYKDICRLFKAPKFDQAQADRLTELYKQAGARYVVPVASHHDNFDMWDSKYHPRWNSVATAGKDVVGMWQKAAAKHGLHLGVASHVARTYRWLQPSHGSDKTGPLAGVPYDGQDPNYADLYGVPWDNDGYGYEGPNDVGPPAFEKNFQDRMFDLIDKYHPDLYYTDGGPPFKTAGYNIVAHLYNESQKWHGGKLEAVVNFKGGSPIGAKNYEYEYPDEVTPKPWQTDKTMSPEWYWLRDRTKDYKKGFEIVHTLIDVVSKNGNLLLNVPLTPDGELEDATMTMLKDMGHDFDLIGEAIFSTRPWKVFGEGQTRFRGISGGKPNDIRFTRNKANTVLYATTLGWPGDGAVVRIKTLNSNRIDLKSLQSMSLLGTSDKLTYHQDAGALAITMPAKAPYECSAYPIKLTFAGQIPDLKGKAQLLWQAQARDISGSDDKSSYGLPAGAGVLLLDVPAAGTAAKAGLKKDDVVVACNGQEANTINDLRALANKAAGAGLKLSVIRKHKPMTVELTDYAYFAMETQASPEFKEIPLASSAVAAKVSAGGSTPPRNNPVDALLDGKVVKGLGPIFANGVLDGAYKLDLGEAKSILQVNTFSAGGGVRPRQNYVLYGSNTASDPGWEVEDGAMFTPIIAVDTRHIASREFEATSVRRSDGKPLGCYRWLVWKVTPVNGDVGGENTAFQELQVIAAGGK